MTRPFHPAPNLVEIRCRWRPPQGGWPKPLPGRLRLLKALFQLHHVAACGHRLRLLLLAVSV